MAGIVDDKESLQIGHVLMAEVLIKLGRHEEALKHRRLELKYAKKLGVYVGDAYIDLIEIFHKMNRQDSMLVYLNHVRESDIFNQLSYEQQGYVLNKYGFIYWSEPEKSLKHFIETKEFYLEHGTIYQAQELDLMIGKKLTELGKYQEAISFLEGYYNRLDTMDLIKQESVLKTISYVYIKLRNFKKTDEYFSRYSQASDALKLYQDSASLAKQNEVTQELFVQYETDKKEQQITLLQEQEKLKDFEISQSKLQIFALLGGLALSFALVVIFLVARNKLQHANQEIQNQNEEIQNQNEEIHQQNEQLIATNERLNELNLEKDHLMDVVAHDLQSPLNNLITITELAIEGNLGKKRPEEYVKIARKEYEQGSNFIRDLLTLHSLEQKKNKFEPIKIPVQLLLSEQADKHYEVAEKKNIKIEVIDSEPILLKTDLKAVNRVLDNLISNAIKFSPPKSMITLATWKDNSRTILSVKDQGLGFTDEDKKIAFRKFQRLSAQPTANEFSNGLGLAIVKSLVNQMEAEIKLISEHGKGSEFQIFFN